MTRLSCCGNKKVDTRAHVSILQNLKGDLSMKKSEKKSLLAVLFGLIFIYALLVVFVPHSSYSNAFTDHFVTVNNAVKGDVQFLGIVVGLVALLYYFLMYRPRKVGKGRKSVEISTARKVVFGLVVVYAILLIVLPYITLSGTAAAWLVTVWDHFIGLKNVITSDFSFLLLVSLVLGGLYYFFVYKPKV